MMKIKTLSTYFLIAGSLFMGRTLCAQTNDRVIGVVKDSATGAPLAAASVTILPAEGTVLTDQGGHFSIKVKATGELLSFEHVGYVKKTLLAQPSTDTLVVLLSALVSELSDVTVQVGYGAVNKKDLTGSISQVNIGDLNRAPVASFDEALAGRVAGVQASSGDGKPGSGVNIVIRGANSVTQSNEPLYVIDGFPIEDPNLNAINPQDILSIDILKDASATSIYGSRGPDCPRPEYFGDLQFE